MQLTSRSYAYPDLDSEVRATVARLLDRASIPNDTFVLSTCLRIEIVVAGDGNLLGSVIRTILGDDPAIERQGLLREGAEAATHLARVVAGLESPVVGEHEILTQFRDALRAAEDSGRVDGLFARLLESLVSIGRRAREMLPGSAHASMASVAAQVVGAFPRVAVLGAGLMSTAVASSLRNLPAPPEVTLVARRPDAVTLHGVEVWPFDKALDVIAEFPAVVSATSAKRRPVPDDELTRALAARDERLTLVDMAMPPDFVPPAGAPVNYLNIDDLARIANRRPRGREADVMVGEAAAKTYRSYAEHDEVGPVIAGLMNEADRLVDEMAERFGSRVSSADDLALLRQAAHTIARSLLASPVSYLKHTDREGAVEAIAEAFGLDHG